MEKVVIKNIVKRFGNAVAVDNVSFTIDEGSFFTFLGPSGCGKTTILRNIAGFIKPDEGNILIGEKDITNVPPENREVGMVFQNYALFPHMNVYENVAYGLKIKRLSKKAIKEKVEKYLSLVRLTGYEKRKVSELSGGEQQRVALARSLAIEPKVLLLDEPLCNLDAKLRDEMRVEIKELQQKLGITTIFVTHDQSEALTMSHKIAIFNKGKCVQIGTPNEVYSMPKNSFVATFVGDTNLFEINKIVSYDENKFKVSIKNNLDLYIKGSQYIEQVSMEGTHKSVGSENIETMKYISIRPQHIEMNFNKRNNRNEYKGVVNKIQFNGSITEYIIEVKEIKFKVTRTNDLYEEEFHIGEEVYINIPENAIMLLKE